MKKRHLIILAAVAALVFGCAAQRPPDYDALRRAEQAGAKITEYPLADMPAGEDILLGTDISDQSMSMDGSTKQYRIGDLPVSDPVTAALLLKQDVVAIATDGEMTTGTETAERLMSPAQIKLSAETHGSGSSYPGVVSDGADGINVAGAVGVGGTMRFLGSFEVVDIPATPAAGDRITVTNGDYPCDATTGGGTYVYDLFYDGALWHCASSDSGDGYNIYADDSRVQVTDPGGGTPGYVAVEADGTEVARFTAAATYLGPIAATAGLAADNTYSSTQLLTGANAGESVAQWQTVYFDATATEFMLADANAAGKWPADGLAVAASTDGQPVHVLRSGFVRNDAWSWPVAARLCLSETGGGVIACADASVCSADGDCYHVIGKAISADVAWFDFSQGWAECNGS
jgi:hypothetical protein